MYDNICSVLLTSYNNNNNNMGLTDLQQSPQALREVLPNGAMAILIIINQKLVTNLQ